MVKILHNTSSLFLSPEECHGHKLSTNIHFVKWKKNYNRRRFTLLTKKKGYRTGTNLRLWSEARRAECHIPFHSARQTELMSVCVYVCVCLCVCVLQIFSLSVLRNGCTESNRSNFKWLSTFSHWTLFVWFCDPMFCFEDICKQSEYVNTLHSVLEDVWTKSNRVIVDW